MEMGVMVMGNNEEITWQSVPDYDEWFWGSHWTCFDWITWYKALKAHYPKDVAKQKWVEGWNGSDSFLKNIDPTDETACLLNPDFANYFKKEGINIDNAFSAVIVAFQTITETTADTGVRLAKFVKAIAPVLAIGVGLYFAAPYLIKLASAKKLKL